MHYGDLCELWMTLNCCVRISHEVKLSVITTDKVELPCRRICVMLASGVVGEFSFMGALIVEEVINDLIRKQGMQKGSKLLLAGSR